MVTLVEPNNLATKKHSLSEFDRPQKAIYFRPVVVVRLPVHTSDSPRRACICVPGVVWSRLANIVPRIADYFILAKAFLLVIISSIGYASNGGDYRQLAGSKLCQPDHQRLCIDRGEHHIHHSCMHCCGLEILHPPTDHQELRPGWLGDWCICGKLDSIRGAKKSYCLPAMQEYNSTTGRQDVMTVSEKSCKEATTFRSFTHPLRLTDHWTRSLRLPWPALSSSPVTNMVGIGTRGISTRREGPPDTNFVWPLRYCSSGQRRWTKSRFFASTSDLPALPLQSGTTFASYGV